MNVNACGRFTAVGGNVDARASGVKYAARVCASISPAERRHATFRRMDLGLLAAVVMLIVWAVATFALDAPGWVHLFLTLGVFCLIWRIAARAATRR